MKEKRDALGVCLPYVCEMYRFAKGLTGYELAELFDRYNLWEYICKNKKRLNDLSERYTVEELDRVLAEYGVFIEGQNPI